MMNKNRRTWRRFFYLAPILPSPAGGRGEKSVGACSFGNLIQQETKNFNSPTDA
jgi:hypothetical protein